MIKILLIEDDQDDVELLEEALADNNVANDMKVLNDGNAALEYIKNCTDCPDLIILDYNLPKVHGRQIILEIKSLNNFKHIPLMILTTSSSKEDIDYAYQHGADKYMVKPTSLAQIKELTGVIEGLVKH